MPVAESVDSIRSKSRDASNISLRELYLLVLGTISFHTAGDAKPGTNQPHLN